jgi:three-Cys-motif partner protein
MSKDNRDFFKEKKEWSIIKDELLACYLKPYIQKIICTCKPVNYIDCFAGTGKFEDGCDGSPLIALKTINDCTSMTSLPSCKINSYFIEPKYTNELRKNITAYNNTTIIPGTYQNEIQNILQQKKGENIFIYLDPFGIKPLRFDLYDYYVNSNFSSIELLINFNSFGFVRECCRVMKVSEEYIKAIEEIIKVFGGTGTWETSSTKDLDEIAGGDYWRIIIEDFKNKVIDCYEAEKRISKEYCKKLNERFKYVIDMPIRLQCGKQPKYRMIHVTNNEDGCLLMFENICKRWEHLGDIQTIGQATLFDETPENDIIDENKVKRLFLEYLSTFDGFTHLNKVVSQFITKYGIICKYQNLQNILKELEKGQKILVKRIPQLTPTGKPSSFFEEKRKENHFVEIMVNK